MKADEYLGPSRCFPFWQELLACYVVNTNTDDISGGKKCLPAMEDYYECLHHRKEVSFRSILGEFSNKNTLVRGVGDGSRLKLFSSWRERELCNMHIDGQRQRIQGRKYLEQVRLGVWGC